MRFGTLQSIIAAKYRAYWVARSHHGVLVSEVAFVVFLRPPFPRTFALGVSSRALSVLYRVSRATTRPSPPGVGHLPWGFLPHRGTISGVNLHGASLALGTAPRASQARFVPSSTFLTSSTACSSADVAGLFHPAATSGLRSSGVSPREKPHGLVARRCPHVVHACFLPPFLRCWHQKPAPAYRALLLSRIRCESRWFRPRPTRAPPELHLPRVFLRKPRECFHTLSGHGLSRPSPFRRFATCPALASLTPRPRFLA